MSYNRNVTRSGNHGAACAQNDMRRSSGSCRESYPFGRAVRTPYGMERLGGWKNTCGQSRNNGGASCPRANNEAASENVCGRNTACRRDNGRASCPWNAHDAHHHADHETARENGCGCHDRDHNCDRLLAQIRAVDFALVEVVLYLDVYPDSCEALETYHKLIARRCALNEEYETACGPLTAMGNKSHTSWDWINKPAPWEYNAN